jgi:hypothetical protein
MKNAQAWVEAGKAAAASAEARIQCPSCCQGTLSIQDIKNSQNPRQWERILECPVCGARNAIRMGAER